MNAVDSLAKYFTGSNVAHHSIGLQLNGQGRKPAETFFAVRAALGVKGYASETEAKRSIEETLRREIGAPSKSSVG